jgi:hypothetical protein
MARHRVVGPLGYGDPVSELPPPPPPSNGSGSPVPPPPPGYPAPPPAHGGPEQGYVGQYHHGFQPIARNARTITILLCVVGALQVIGIPVQIALHDKAQKFLAGGITKDAFQSALHTQQNVSGFQGGSTLAIGILTIVWMRKLINNHRLLGRPGSRWSPGWAIGGWFVPPGAVYAVPWLIFKELWRGSDPANVANDPNWKQRPVSPLIHLWWVLYGFIPIIGTALTAGTSIASLRGVASSTDIDVAKLYTHNFVLQFVIAVLGIAGTAVFALLVQNLTRRQRALTGEG